MPEDTPKLSLPLIQSAQAQKHVTHNEALERLDILTQLTVEDFGATTPPSSPNDGQNWIIGDDATGDWAGEDGKVVSWRGGGWLFIQPRQGWRAWSKGSDEFRVYSSGNWITIGGDSAGSLGFENLDGVGINATSDSTNKLSIASDATLFSHDGAGHQFKLNKAGPTDTASLLYQTDFSGRAEMGLAGNDDFSIKVSADGATFTEALRIAAATGHVDMPTSPSRQIVPYSYRYSLLGDKRWCAPLENCGSANASENLGTGAEPNIAWRAKGVFVPAGSVLHAFRLAGNMNNTEITGLDLRVYFQTGPWNASWNSNGETTRQTLFSANDAGFDGGTALQRLQIALDFTAPEDGYFFAAIRPNAASTPTATRYFFATGALDASLARL